MPLYPRTCQKCGVTYQHSSSFSKHKAKNTCENQCLKNAEKIIINASDNTTVNNYLGASVEDMNNVVNIITEKLRLETEKQLEELKTENERLKARDDVGPLAKFDGALYIAQTAQFFTSKQNVFKIGRTNQPINNRIQGYDKGCELIYYCKCLDHCDAEAKAKKEFRSKFIPRTDIGTEFFEGDIDTMISVMQNLTMLDR